MEPPKGILRKKKAEHPPKISWDEETIRQHDLQRGKIPKIPQPKTPYHSDQEEDSSQQIDDQQLKEYLSEALANRTKNRAIEKGPDIAKLNAELKKEDWKNEPDSEDQLPEEQRRRKQEFRKMRAQHYRVPKQLLKK